MFYYTLSVLLSAFLLFQVQLVVNKYILPWFGGTPAVWSTSMLFFQVLLTGGYAYAYWLIGRKSTRRQGSIHLILLGLSLGLLLLQLLLWQVPLLPGLQWRPQDVSAPIWHIFAILFVAVGLPYFILSTNSTLMQGWFTKAFPSRSPYWLYALSNAGSLLGLITYPFLVEPLLRLRTQAVVWSAGYLAFALCAGIGAIWLMRLRSPIGQPAAAEPAEAVETVPAPPSLRIRLFWVALAAFASVMLLAVTTQVCQEVAVVPFLWVLPLVLYLLTFILAFGNERWYSRTFYMIALLVTSALFCLVYTGVWPVPLVLQITVYCLTLFVCCMVCHGELVRLKPAPRYLTSFYLMVSVGGAIGGIAVNLIAPYVFKGLWELPLGLIGVWVLLLIAYETNRPARWTRGAFVLVPALSLSTIAALFLILFYAQSGSANVKVLSRNFYGILRVQEINTTTPGDEAYQLAHGATVHGFQYISEAKKRSPTAYFTEKSGVGLAILNYPRHQEGLRIGILGLGVGTLAAYGQTGDTMRFYEINPAVIQLAQSSYFTYLQDCPGQVDIVAGDARISLDQELQAGDPQYFDLLVLDVFNSDSIPVHLLTKEAFEIYLQHLKPGGVLVLHITNRYLDLLPVVSRLASYFQLKGVLVQSQGDGQRSYPAKFVLLTRNEAFLNLPEIAGNSVPLAGWEDFPLWTDDYSNLFRLLK